MGQDHAENYFTQNVNNSEKEKLGCKSITVLGISYVADKYLQTLWESRTSLLKVKSQEHE